MAVTEDISPDSGELSAAKLALLEKWRRGQLKAAVSQSHRIPRRAERGFAPVSFAQQRLWFLDQLVPGNPFYNEHVAIPMTPPFRVDVMEKVLNEIIRRHEALRTTIESVNGEPHQVIAPRLHLKLPVIDLRHLPEESREAAAQRLADEEAELSFDMARGPLMRASLLRTSDEDYLFSLTMHHIVGDGWSMDVFYRELTVLYEAFSANRPSPLPPLPIQYADFASWQRQYLVGEVLEEQLGYWKKQLAGLATLQLPTDRPRPVMQSFRGATVPIRLDQRVQTSLQELCEQERATSFMVLLTGFQALLSRYSAQNDIVVGSPIANRHRAELEPLIGFFVNMLVMRADLSGDPTFREALRRVREMCLAAYAHQDLPFEKLVDELQPERDLSRNPLFQVIFQFVNVPRAHGEEATEDDLIAETDTGPKRKVSKFDLRLDMWDTAVGFGGEFEYSRDLFDASTIDRMAKHLQTLLEAIADNPDKRLSQLSLMSDDERKQLLVDWNETQSHYPREDSIASLFEAQVENTPEAIAVVFGEQPLTFEALNHKANQVAHYLRRVGVGAEVIVGIHMERSIEMVVGLLGILKAGGAYLPLDPQYPKERLSFMIDDSGVRLLLTQRELRNKLPMNLAAQVISLDEDWAQIARESEQDPRSNVNADNLAYVIYTSGSTGQPKGLGAIHRGVARLVKGTNYHDLTERDVILQIAPLSFDASTFEIWGALLNGACLAIFPSRALSPDELGAAIRRHGVTTLFITTGLFHQMVEDSVQELTPLRHVMTGGDVLSVAHLEKALQSLGENTRLTNFYGPTENTTFTSYFPITKKTAPSRSVPIGRAVSNTQIYVLDRNMDFAPVGVAGELYLGGDGIVRGYLNRPDLTAEKFVPHPFTSHAGERLYKTGDMARYRVDGNLEFLGRFDDQVKVRGFRIELAEVEATLVQHAAVSEAIVMARGSGASDKRLIAYVVPRAGESPTVSELRHFMKEKLPEFMLPSSFIMLKELPLMPSGKIDRQALPLPDTARPALAALYAPPETPAEQLLAKIWASVLRLEQVGIHDNFFELGGDSILTIQITARANQAGLQLAPKQVFLHQTISELAAVAGTAARIEAEQGLVMGDAPLTPIQHWFFEQDLAESHHFNQSVLLEVPPTWNSSLSRMVIRDLILHHDALRFRYRRDESGWRQIHAGVDEPLPFSHLDLSRLEEEEQVAAIEATAAEMQGSLNLSEGPILRSVLFELGGEKPNRLLIVIHHLAVDGVSWRILAEDLQTAFDKLKTGAIVELPPKTTSFKRWAERLVEHAQSEPVRQELSYWLSQSPRDHVFRLPTDFARGVNTMETVEEVLVSLSAEETRALLQDVPAAYHTQVNDALLTALLQAFSEWTGVPFLLLNLEGHGRVPFSDDLDVSRTVGWFTSLFPVLLNLEGAAGPGEALKSVKEQLRTIPNSGIGYGLLRYLSDDPEIAARLKSLPCPEVSFNYLGQFGQSSSQSEEQIGTAGESSGSMSSPLERRRQLLDIDGSVDDDQLSFRWAYSKNFHRGSTIETLAESFVNALRALIAHCQSPKAGGHTPSDFSKARLSQRDLDSLLDRLGQSKASGSK